MTSQIVVDFEAIQEVINIVSAVEKEIDSVTSEIFYIKASSGEEWSGEARAVFSDNCHKVRQKGVEVTYNVRKNREKLQEAVGVFVLKEMQNKNVEQNLSTENIFV